MAWLGPAVSAFPFAHQDPDGRAEGQAEILAKLHRDTIPIDIT
jgi:hypothetical protein